MTTVEQLEKVRRDYWKSLGIKTCRENKHKFNVTTKECGHKHCSICGECQVINGCYQIIRISDTKRKED